MTANIQTQPCAYCNASYIGGALMHEHHCKRPLYAGALERQGIGGTDAGKLMAASTALIVRQASAPHETAVATAMAQAIADNGGAARATDRGLVVSGTWVLTPAALMAIAQAVLDAG